MEQDELLELRRRLVGMLSISTKEGFSLIKLNEILYLKADGNYTDIHLTNSPKVTSTKNLGYFENELLHEPFLRIHHSHIVNLTKVASYLRAENGYVVLETGKKLSVSRSKREEVLDIFSTPLANHVKKSVSHTKVMLNATKEVGWLVVHDEKTSQQTLSLKQGKQIVGRTSEEADKKADLMIDTEDEYMSRKHFIINVELNASGGFDYYLSDNISKNKTFLMTDLKTKELNKGDKYTLQDGDVIQAGQTNIVFKTIHHVKNKKEATQVVAGLPKEKTVVV